MIALPRLRQDLQLLPRTRGAGGTPAWLLYDRPRHRYFRLGWIESEMLRRWQRVSDGAQLLAKIRQESTVPVEEDDLHRFVRFLTVNQLLQPQGEADRHRLLTAAQQKPSGWRWLLHHYLFFTIPLWHPDPFLNRWQQRLPWLFRSGWLWLLALCGLLGLFLVSRQWDRFLATLPPLSWQGGIILFLALTVAKAVHEGGHAWVAKRYGCHIASMGVAFLVLWPVLYIDTTDVWRLPCPKQRRQVAMAGMVAEWLLAGVACLLWSLTDNPLWQSGLFTLAAVSWLMALAVNANPLMRFDGYFLLADMLDMANLQERSFALGRWQLRRWLFKMADPPPETFAPARQRLLIAFAWSVWLYRFFLFIGIALLVYHTFFKLLGIFLMGVEITWFILLPAWREGVYWWQMRQHMASGAITRPALLLLLFLALLVLPWQTKIVLPALWHSHTFTTLYPPTAARVESLLVQPGQRVEVAQPLLILHAPDLEQKLLLNRLEEEHWLYESQRPGVNDPDREQRLLAVRQLAATQAQQQGLQALRQRLLITAPFAGLVDTPAESVAVGRWVGTQDPLLLLHQTEDRVIHAYVDEQQHPQIQVGASGWFVAQDLSLPRCAVLVEEVAAIALAALDWPHLATVHGGRLAVRKEGERLVPDEALYRVQLRPVASSCPLPDKMIVGDLFLHGGQESVIAFLWRRMMATLLRESGF
ncbi:MAG: peptidase M50 [Magnetococcales bacterium]|nr:peptidase M50 [Magnetococcales bacterium]